jgi:hypothetical protein
MQPHAPSIFQRTEKQRAAVRKIQGNPFYVIFAVGCLFFGGSNILHVLRTGQILSASRSHYNEMITYAGHPIAFVFSTFLSLFMMPLGLVCIYAFFFLQIDD